MEVFKYTALDENGRKHKGAMEADSARQLRSTLREKGLNALTVEEMPHKRRALKNHSGQALQTAESSRIKRAELVLIAKQLATLIEAGITVDESLRLIADQQIPRVKNIMLAVRTRVLEGESFAASMADFSGSFPNLFRQSIAAGEQAGKLDIVLNKMAEHLERQQQIHQKVVLALIYPAILGLVCITVIVVLLGFVFPDVIAMFTKTGRELPMLTVALISVSHFIVDYGIFILALIAAALLAAKAYIATESNRLRLHQKLLQLPLIGKTLRDVSTVSFSNTLHILYASGVPLMEALATSAQVVPNLYIRRKIKEAAKNVGEGHSLQHALTNCNLFSPMLLQMIGVGEQSGRLHDMLEKASWFQTQNLERNAALFATLLGPIVILCMGGMVMLLVLAILMPILSVNQLVM